MEALARDAAILLSFALQFGIDPMLMQAAVTREEDGKEPASLIGAVIDAMVRLFPLDPEPGPDPSPSPDRTAGPATPLVLSPAAVEVGA